MIVLKDINDNRILDMFDTVKEFKTKVSNDLSKLYDDMVKAGEIPTSGQDDEGLEHYLKIAFTDQLEEFCSMNDARVEVY